jgi:hypothetical protein
MLACCGPVSSNPANVYNTGCRQSHARRGVGRVGVACCWLSSFGLAGNGVWLFLCVRSWVVVAATLCRPVNRCAARTACARTSSCPTETRWCSSSCTAFRTVLWHRRHVAVPHAAAPRVVSPHVAGPPGARALLPKTALLRDSVHPACSLVVLPARSIAAAKCLRRRLLLLVLLQMPLLTLCCGCCCCCCRFSCGRADQDHHHRSAGLRCPTPSV